MEKQYTPAQLSVAEEHLSFALFNAQQALLELDEPIPNDSTVPYNIDSEVSCCYWYIYQTRESVREMKTKV